MKKTFCCIIAIFILLSFSGCSRNNSYNTTFFAMDTFMEITLYTSNEKALLKDCKNIVINLENMLSATKTDSEVFILNRDYVLQNASVDLIAIIEYSETVSRQTNGAFDITVFPLICAWGFDNSSKEKQIPSSQEISDAVSKIDYSKLHIENTTIYSNGAAIDFGGIAKGYASQKISDYLRDNGVASALINLGGNVQVIGDKPDGSPYKIGIANPADPNSALGVVKVSDKAVVTSGIYQRYFTENGKIYHHIFDTSTGYPCDNGLVSVTVICENGMHADALSSALFTLGLEGGIKYHSTYGGFEAIFITSENKIVITPGLQGVFDITDKDNYTLEISENNLR